MDSENKIEEYFAFRNKKTNQLLRQDTKGKMVDCFDFRTARIFSITEPKTWLYHLAKTWRIKTTAEIVKITITIEKVK